MMHKWHTVLGHLILIFPPEMHELLFIHFLLVSPQVLQSSEAQGAAKHARPRVVLQLALVAAVSQALHSKHLGYST